MDDWLDIKEIMKAIRTLEETGLFEIYYKMGNGYAPLHTILNDPDAWFQEGVKTNGDSDG